MRCSSRQGSPSRPAEECVVFAGDVSLSRGVARELGRRTPPFASLRRELGARDRWIGNLQGSIARGSCARSRGPCLGIASRDLGALRGVFAGLSLANNHVDDHGAAGRSATRAALARLGIVAIDEESGPHLLELAGLRFGLVAVNLVNRTAAEIDAALHRARLQIGLARAQTPRVVVLPHWGREHDERVWASQERAAEIFRAWGALLVVGSHVHRVQEVRAEAGSLVYFGLGDHAFDLGPLASPEALLVRCCPRGDPTSSDCGAASGGRSIAGAGPRSPARSSRRA